MLSSDFKVGDYVAVREWEDGKEGSGVGLGKVVDDYDVGPSCIRVEFGYLSTKPGERTSVHCQRIERVEIPQE